MPGKRICGLVVSVFLDKHVPSVHRFIGRFLIHSVTLVTGMTSVTEMLKKKPNKPKQNKGTNNTSGINIFIIMSFAL